MFYYVNAMIPSMKLSNKIIDSKKDEKTLQKEFTASQLLLSSLIQEIKFIIKFQLG